MKPTKEQFEEYVEIRDLGITNMYDVKVVCLMSHTGLTKDHCIYIMQNFEELANEYGVDV